MFQSLLLVIAFAFTLPFGSIVMRHDVEDARYLELGARYSDSFVRLDAGCGTFIRSNWILTAAHVAQSERVGDSVSVDGIRYPIARKILHPGFSMSGGAIIHDIALIELSEPVPEIQPALLYSASDELGREIVFVGTGWAGTGVRGMANDAIIRDRRLRGAQNRVDGSKPGYLQFTFDAPESGNALPLEGISGPGDSGGPALWVHGDGRTYVLGVSSHQNRQGAKNEGMYGVVEYYARVSEYRDWIGGEIEAE
ncbi:MAG: trypsin-like serine protease [Acidobacteria bacterium]|nr:trypsin-like serine protease [Acidobacteriota bacterium]